jgi:iron only hydrogenase large subunit-like protein
MLAMIGEGKTRGQAAILEIEACHNQNTAALRVNQNCLSSKLLYNFFYYTYQETRRIGSGNNQKALNKNRISNMLMPLMSFEEQKEIVQEIESRLSVCDKIEETIETSLVKSEALRQSILKKSFEGKLLREQELENIKNHPEYESAEELLKRIKERKNLPMITTCCPGWILMMEYFYHDLIPLMSTCKSPHEMSGMLIKSYYAEQAKINPKDIVVVSMMPCTAKKFESTRAELKTGVDYVLTTRELGRLIKQRNIDFVNLKDEDFDSTLGLASGAGDIFGAAGGVMEAALRTTYEISTKKKLKKVEFTNLRTNDSSIREGKIKLGNKTIRYATASGGANIRKLLRNKDKYDFIEMMACPGGCIGGGGQPIYSDDKILQLRAQALYKQDSMREYRRSHENPIVQDIYKKYLGKPGSKKAEKLLHTKYQIRDKF